MDSNTEYRSPLDQAQNALRQLIDSRDNVERLEVRLEVMLSRWTRLEEQHARALADLQHSAGRIQELERRLQQHLERPRDGLEGAQLGGVLSALKALLDAFERVEARLAAREDELARWLGEARRDLHGLTAVPRADASPTREIEPRPPGRGFVSPWLAGAALVATVVVLAYVLQLRGRILESDSRVREAAQHAREIQEEAGRELVAMRVESAREAASAREHVAKATTLADVLAAPDLIRFDLVGTTLAPRARGQGLWSRSRGFVFTASRLPSPPGAAYQLWLVTPGMRVSLGLVKPDPMGRVTLATDTVPSVTGPVVGLLLTGETEGGSGAPSGAVYLARPS